jgi:hypothetical protein
MSVKTFFPIVNDDQMDVDQKKYHQHQFPMENR